MNLCRQKIIDMLEEIKQDVMQVFDFGARKHPDSGDTPNFLTPEGNKCELRERGSSILRHAARTFMKPNVRDEESGLNEYLHLLASVCILYIRNKRNICHPNDTCEHVFTDGSGNNIVCDKCQQIFGKR